LDFHVHIFSSPHLCGPRQLQPGQLIHESVFREMDNGIYRPKAHFYDKEIQWDLENLEARGMVEKDPYTQAGHLLSQFEKTNSVSKEDFDAFPMLAETGKSFSFVDCTALRSGC
jgi:hypothetical protein